MIGAFGLARQRPPEDKRIITTTRSHMTSSVTEAINACQPTEVLQVGGAGHKVSNPCYQLLPLSMEFTTEMTVVC